MKLSSFLRISALLLVLVLPGASTAQIVLQNFSHSSNIEYVVGRSNSEYYISVSGNQIGVWSGKNGFATGMIELSQVPRYVTLSKDGMLIFVWFNDGHRSTYNIISRELVSQSIFDQVLIGSKSNSYVNVRFAEISPDFSKVIFVVQREHEGGIYIFSLEGDGQLISKHNFKKENRSVISFPRMEDAPTSAIWLNERSLEIYFNHYVNKDNSKVLVDLNLKPLKYDRGTQYDSGSSEGKHNGFPQVAFSNIGGAKIEGRRLVIRSKANAKNQREFPFKSYATDAASIIKAEFVAGSEVLVIQSRTNSNAKNISVFDMSTTKLLYRFFNVEDFAISKKGSLILVDRSETKVVNLVNGVTVCNLDNNISWLSKQNPMKVEIRTSYDRELVALILGESGRGKPSLINLETCQILMSSKDMFFDGKIPYASNIEFISSTNLLIVDGMIIDVRSKKIIGRMLHAIWSFGRNYYLSNIGLYSDGSNFSGATPGKLTYRVKDHLFQWIESDKSMCRISTFQECTSTFFSEEYISGPLISASNFQGNGNDGSFRWETSDGIEVTSDIGRGIFLRQLRSIKNRNYTYVGTENNQVLPVIFSDGLLRLYRKGYEEPLINISVTNSGSVLVRTPEGYFSSQSIDTLGDLAIEVNGQLQPISSFWEVFNRPDIVLAKYSGYDIRALVGIFTLENALKSPPPSIKSIVLPEGDLRRERLTIPYTLKSEGGGIGEILIFQNGKLMKSDGHYRDAPGSTVVSMSITRDTSQEQVSKGMNKMLGVAEANASFTSSSSNKDRVVVRQAKPKTLNAGGEFSDTVEIDVIPGEENEITVMARNGDNTILGQGQTVRFKSTLPKVDPHLWILPIGIGTFQDSGISKLVSPKKDALDFACSYGGKEALMMAGVNCDKPGHASSLFNRANIHVLDPLTNEKATRANILAKLDEIAAKAKPTDTFIWFVSSHGTMDSNSVYGIVPFDAKCQGAKCEAASGLISSNDILEKSKAIKAMKQLLILDTCNAGGLDNKMSGLYDARMSGLAKNMGLHLYAAATATESALDGQDASKNSIFTATLLEGLAGASSKNAEGQISIVPLGQYVKINTAEASRKAYPQDTPQTPVIQHFGKDAPLVTPIK